MRLRLFVLSMVVSVLGSMSGAALAPAAAQASGIPAWLQAHVGTGDGKIAPVVLERARGLYQRKVAEGTVVNPCYMAMDATRPSISNGEPGRRYYIICEQDQAFWAISSGYGNGRNLKRADFSNGRMCAKNFSNAEGSKLTAGGIYVTAETRTSFKGYRTESGKKTPFHRTFILFDGEGETANARERAIGGHEARFLKWQCRYKNSSSPHADEDGYVPFGRMVNYTSGRSNGCTTWSPFNADLVLAIVQDNPTTLYIYPEGRDIDAVAAAVKSGKSPSRAGLYWNDTCLRAIGAPKFWPKETLQPIIDEWRASLPKTPYKPLPICR